MPRPKRICSKKMILIKKHIPIVSLFVFSIVVGCGPSSDGPEDQPGENNADVTYRENPTPVSDWQNAAKPVGPEYWKGEFLAGKAENELQQFGDALTTVLNQSTAPGQLTSQFQLSGWNQGQLTPVYSNGELIVRGNDLSKKETNVWTDPATSTALPPLKALQVLMAPWAKCQSIQFHCEVDDIAVHDNYYLTNASVSILGIIQNQGSRQATMNWLIQWTMPIGEQAPKINAIQVTSYDESSFLNPAGKMFSDCTGSVLQGIPALNEQFGIGSVDWTRKIGARRIRNWYGVSVCDINNDYLDDFYVCQGRGVPNRLFIQKPDGSVEDISVESGTAFSEPTNCALFADLDNDGDQDLLLAVQAGITILVNDGKNRFHFKTVLFGAKNAICLAAVDYDNDNDLDIFAGGYLPELRPDNDFPAMNDALDATNGGGVTLYQNDGNMNFEERTDRSDLDSTRFVTGLFFHDQDQDGDDDLFVTSDFGPIEYFQNRGDWFSKASLNPAFDQPALHRSLNWIDFDSDGKDEIVVTTGSTPMNRRIAREHVPTEELLIEKVPFSKLVRGNYLVKTTENLVELPRVPKADFSLNTLAFDVNGDGTRDLMTTNGGTTRKDRTNWAGFYWREIITRYKLNMDNEARRAMGKLFFVYSNHMHAGGSHDPGQRSSLILNTGRNRLVDISAISGLDRPLDSRSSCYLDWDHDGDWDVLQVNAKAPQVILSRNESRSTGNFVKIALRGTISNTEGIGSTVRVHLTGQPDPLVQRLSCYAGMMTQQSRILRFAIPANGSIEKIVVRWPNGNEQTFAGVPINQMYRLMQGTENATPIRRAQPATRFVPSPAPVNQEAITHSRIWPKLKRPTIEYQPAGQDQWIDLPTSKNMTVVHLCSRSDSGLKSNLAQMRGFGDEYDAVVLSVDDVDFGEQPSSIRYGKISEYGIDLLRVFGSEVFADANHFATPCWILLDNDARVTTTYSGQLDLKMLDKDREELASVGNDMFQPFPRFEHRQISNLLVPDYLRLAETYSRSGYMEESRITSQYTKAQLSLGYCQRAQMFVERGDIQRAMKLIKQAIDKDPNCREAFLLLGKLELMLVQESNDQNPEYIATATEYFERALLLDPGNVDARLGLADLAEQKGNVDEAIEIIDSAISHLDRQRLMIDQKYRLFWIKGRLYFRKNDYAAASKALSTAFDMRPIEVALVTDLAMVYAASNDLNSALSFFILAQKLAPNESSYTKTVGVCHFILGDYANSIQSLEKAAEMASRDRLSRLMLAWIYSTCPNEKLRNKERALTLAKPVANVFRDSSPQAMEVYAAALAENGDFKSAIAAQSRAIELAKTLSLPPDEVRPIAEMESRLSFYQKNQPLRMTDKRNHPFPRMITSKGMYMRSFR